MNSSAAALQEKYTDSTRLAEKDSGTIWHGGSNVTLSDLLDAAWNNPLYRIEDDVAIVTTSKSKIAANISEAAAGIPVISRKNPGIERSYALQEWEGSVLEVRDDTFTAELCDVTSPDNPKEQADFLIEDLRKDDLALLRPGAIFRWVIGYEIKKDGGKRRFSQLIFRRLPQWTQAEIKLADSEARALMDSIHWD